MGEALLSRLITQRIYAPDAILVSEPQPQRRDWLNQQYGVRTTTDNPFVATTADVLLLAIKPQMFESVTAHLQDSDRANRVAETPEVTRRTPLVISILAGVPLQRLETAFPDHPVIRAMPNTPATVGAGVTALAAGQQVNSQHLEQATTLFRAVGEVVEVPESLMDAVTGLSGSGPGYLAVAIEALIDGGVSVGLSRPVATKLAIQTVLGTAQLLAESGMHPAELKDRVTSPGGTTIAGIAHLEQAGFRAALIGAVRAACDRAKQLGS